MGRMLKAAWWAVDPAIPEGCEGPESSASTYIGLTRQWEIQAE